MHLFCWTANSTYINLTSTIIYLNDRLIFQIDTTTLSNIVVKLYEIIANISSKIPQVKGNNEISTEIESKLYSIEANTYTNIDSSNTHTLALAHVDSVGWSEDKPNWQAHRVIFCVQIYTYKCFENSNGHIRFHKPQQQKTIFGLVYWSFNELYAHSAFHSHINWTPVGYIVSEVLMLISW